MRRTALRDYIEPLLVAVVLAIFVRTFLVQGFQIPSPSMEEGLQIGDHILVNKFVLPPWPGTGSPLLPMRAVQRGEVVVFRFPGDPRRDFVKRCVGLPGDEVEIERKRLVVNGVAVDEPYVRHTDPRTYPRSLLLPERLSRRDNFGPLTVPAGHYFCLGDNRDNSNDSRAWGPVPAQMLKGRALITYWSDAGTDDPPAKGLLGRLRSAWSTATHFVQRTRWERMFRLVR